MFMLDLVGVCGSTFGKVDMVISLVLAVFVFAYFRKYLKLPVFKFTPRTKEWCVEGVVMEHNTLLYILKDIAKNLLGIAYLFFTLFFAISAFETFRYFGKEYISVVDYIVFPFLIRFFVLPIIVRIIFEVLVIFLPLVLKFVWRVVKFVWGIVKTFVVFMYNYIIKYASVLLNMWLRSAEAILSLFTWLKSFFDEKAARNNVSIEKIKAEKVVVQQNN